MTHAKLLRQIYSAALDTAFTDDAAIDSLDDDIKEHIGFIVSRSESNKGMVTVLTTLLVHKSLVPEQDIRYHQAGMEGGFAGRGIDHDHVTPFMKSVSFPAMSESGWLTRSLEQAHPYDMDYPGKISPTRAKTAFLTVIDKVQSQKVNAEDVLRYMFVLLIRQRESMVVELAKPHSLSIDAIIALLRRHFSAKYSSSGASRLPTLAVYAAYQCMMTQISRYEGKILCSLASHNASDIQSGRIGDIDVNYSDGSAFEGVEIKHGIGISHGHVKAAYEKFKIHNTDRYYLLTTADMQGADWDSINAEIQRLAIIHGCQVIVNGVFTTLKYYLRLLRDPAEFIDRYVECLKTDDVIKYQHKTAWNDIISNMNTRS
jgi:DNA (cytosine-5)-methyltransferase 1